MKRHKGGILLADRKPASKKAEKKTRKKLVLRGVSGPQNDIQVGIDTPMFLIIMVLLVFGVIMMFSAGYAWAIEEGLEGTYYANRQIVMAAIGVAGMLVISLIDYHFFQKEMIVAAAYFGALALMICCFIPGIRSPHNYSYRWIKIGVEFQPSEIGKLALILVFAYFISLNYSRMKNYKVGVLPFMLLLGIYAVVLVKQPHFSATIIMVVICFSMMLIGGVQIKHLVVMGILAVIAIAGYMFYLTATGQFSYIQDRINCFLHPFDSRYETETWQTRNSLIAIGSGGLFGLGLGNSRQKFLYLPESKNDFVFAVVCEELGFVGAMLVIVLFLMFIVRGFTIACKAVDKSGMLIASGITIQIGLQALLNIAVVSNAVPNTGVSLPFFSYGGTALIMQLWEMGILLNISRHAVVSSEEYERRKFKGISGAIKRIRGVE
mgnify:FL=1